MIEHITEEQVKDAFRIVEAEYWQDVRGFAEDIRDRVASGELDRDDTSDAVHEACDGATRIIYTWWARVTLCCASNPDAYQDEMGEPAPTVESQAYMAFRQDVEEHLSTLLNELDESEEE